MKDLGHPKVQEEIKRDFRHFYYRYHKFASWKGVESQKNPMDLWVYQELIYSLRPDFVIELGTHFGGTAMFLADFCNLINHGHVVTVDVTPGFSLDYPNTTFILGSSINEGVFEQVEDIVGDKTCLVILDSDHKRDHVLREMELYKKFVYKDFYLIVEDTEYGTECFFPDEAPGPGEAVKLFLGDHPEFVVDTSIETHYQMTWNPGGYLRRV